MRPALSSLKIERDIVKREFVLEPVVMACGGVEIISAYSLPWTPDVVEWPNARSGCFTPGK